MDHKTFIDIFLRKSKLIKKEREEFYQLINNEEYINSFLLSPEYQVFLQKNLPLISHVLKYSLKEGLNFINKEPITHIKELVLPLSFNKEIDSIKKIKKLYPVAHSDIQFLINLNNSNTNNNNSLNFKSHFFKNNSLLIIDIYNNYKQSLNKDEIYILDTEIKKSFILELNNTITEESTKLKKMANKYPFEDFDHNYNTDITYYLLAKIGSFNYNLDFIPTVLENTKKIKIPEEKYIDFILQSIKYKNNKTFSSSTQLIPNILKNHIPENTYIPNLINKLNSISSVNNFYYSDILEPLINYFAPESFRNIKNEPDSNSNVALQITALYYILKNDIPCETTPQNLQKLITDLLISTKNLYKDRIMTYMESYDSKILINAFKLLNNIEKDINNIRNNIDISSIFKKNSDLYKEKSFFFSHTKKHNRNTENEEKTIKNNLNESHALIHFLIQEKIYPNMSYKNESIFYITDVEDKIIQNKINKIKDNEPFFLLFLHDIINEENLSFYLNRENFISDLFTSPNYNINTYINSLHKKDKIKIEEKLTPLKEKFIITENLKSTQQLEENKKSTIRRRI